ncbi:MAG: amino-acid N-acetyltransferase, partial [Opitutaceae bacterium]|nr:amino-acid N-acetyltransferase [Opitutaceae bacterium]
MSSTQQTPSLKPTDLRGILKYVPRFKDHIFIIALDGIIVEDSNLPNLLLDIAVLRSLQIKIVLVYGIGAQLQKLSDREGTSISDLQGTGVTDKATLDLAIQASSDVSHQILEGLTQTGLKCALTNSIRAIPVGVVKGIDQQFNGKIDRIDQQFILHLLKEGVIPIIQPIGFDRNGYSLRINSDLLATETGIALEASKIIFLTPDAGLIVDGNIRRQIPVEELTKLLEENPNSIDANTCSKATHAIAAIEKGIPRIHLIDGKAHDSLLNEIFSSEGIGTLIYGNEYQQIRQASRKDVRLIYNLTRNSVRKEELVHRTLQSIEKNIERFYVFEIDENIIACISLNDFPSDPEFIEIGSLFVLQPYGGRGIGKKMVDFACMEAGKKGANKVIALSTQNFSFFTTVCGFVETTKDIL